MLLVPLFLGAALAQPIPAEPSGGAVPSASFFSLQAKTLDGKPAELATYAGKVVVVVNVASQCGFTPQYKGLEALYEEMKDKGVVVLGFPSNEFGGQEPGTEAEIQAFCQKNYGVTFPMFSKIVTKPGPDQSPVYAFLTQIGSVPNWNFCKYVVGKDGKVKSFFPSKVKPEDAELRDALAKALAE
jgi:glutathione peroxidase